MTVKRIFPIKNESGLFNDWNLFVKAIALLALKDNNLGNRKYKKGDAKQTKFSVGNTNQTMWDFTKQTSKQCNFVQTKKKVRREGENISFLLLLSSTEGSAPWPEPVWHEMNFVFSWLHTREAFMSFFNVYRMKKKGNLKFHLK